MSKEDSVFKATIDPNQRSMVDLIKKARGLKTDSELIRILIFDEARRLNLKCKVIA